MQNDTVRVNRDVAIPLDELELRASRSSGPGGQGVNTTDSRVELRFDVAGSAALRPEDKTRILHKLASRIDSRGVLRVVAQAQRSQLANRRDALERFAALLAEALRGERARRPTRPSAGAEARRLAAKARRAELKRSRRPPSPDE